MNVIEALHRQLLKRMGSRPAELAEEPVRTWLAEAVGGGKGLRGMLCLCAARSLGAEEGQADDLAVAVELVHAASLLVDDLPCFDDAATRRGQPAFHVRHGDAAAILTSHALVVGAFELIAGAPLPAEVRVRLSASLARAIGGQGMVRGEYLDIAGGPDATQRTDDLLRKTTVLFEWAAEAGAMTALGAEDAAVAGVAEAGSWWGVAYQLADDLQDDDLTGPELEALAVRRTAALERAGATLPPLPEGSSLALWKRMFEAKLSRAEPRTSDRG